MNCKKGDLAICIFGEDSGKIVNCLELVPDGCTIMGWNPSSEGALWKVDADMTWWTTDGGQKLRLPYAPDKNLKPLRDEEGTDEMILLAGNPNKQTADV